jgi:hypothetical protein
MDEQNVVKAYCWACGYEVNEQGQCLRPYIEDGFNCKESIYNQGE